MGKSFDRFNLQELRLQLEKIALPSVSLSERLKSEPKCRKVIGYRQVKTPLIIF